ncbi:MAG: adenylyl-sulfate kinase [Candidatus Hydrothermota bacterium]|nr:MAG: adenylyl-sulfate kinase [Candidatus Hydrothermae bacterium]
MDKACTIWFTGLPSSGKSTIANRVAEILKNKGYKVEQLDGDVTRKYLSKGLGFTKEDRDENIRRVGFVAKLLTRNGVFVTAAFVSPYREIRDEIRKEIGNFVEVYVKCPVEVCIERDVKGMYKKALKGEIKNFTGIDDPYEEPLNPEVIVETDKETVEESVGKVMRKLAELGYIDEWSEPEGYSEEEEEIVKKRLENLGYY